MALSLSKFNFPIAAYPCPTSSPVNPSVSRIPSPSTATQRNPLIGSTLIAVTETQIPTNTEIDQTLPIWLIVTVAAVIVAFAMTCTCVLVTAILIFKKRGTRATKENLRNIIIQNEIYDQASIKTLTQSIKLKVYLCLLIYDELIS
jgi:hypothetical protein